MIGKQVDVFFFFVKNRKNQSCIHDARRPTARRLLSMQDQILKYGSENTSG